MIVSIFQYISKLIRSTSLKIAKINYDNQFENNEITDNKSGFFISKKLKASRLIASAFWGNFNPIGKIALTCFLLLVGYDLLNGWFFK